MNASRFIEANKKALKSLWNSFPIIVGAVLLVAFATSFVPHKIYSTLFMGNYFVDPFIGGLLGSILAGNPITSYILGGEFLKQGISLVAVTAFIVAWVTVGVIQLPAEGILLGKKFAITRNIVSFIFSIIVAIITVILVNLL